MIEPAAKHGLDVGIACDANGNTLLHLAVRNHLTDAVRVLLRLGCSPTLANKLHDTPAQAMATLEELEETARLQLLCPAPDLTAVQIDELRQTFGAHW